MRRLILSASMLSICFLLDVPLRATENNNTCTSRGGSLYSWIEQKIKLSPHSKILPVSCVEIHAIGKYVDNDIILTSGRKRGEFIICMSNTKENPCKHQIGELIGFDSPSVLINRIFGATKKANKEFLNETVERLFLKPSKLIKTKK